MSLDSKSYTLKNKIYCRRDSSAFNYSDGDFYEKKMLALLQQTKDVSTQSVEILKHIDSWVLEYHFSQARHNLLRGLTLENFENVLELGSGCGAVTRQLGEHCRHVTCVEGSFQRALIGAERCRDLDNVSIFCDNFQNIQAIAKFDLITMIGVLEYASLFVQGNDPTQKILQQLVQYLTDDGILLIAIENQLGLKYFNGCSEDHQGDLFFGINDLYHEKTAITFGYQELKQRILQAGFSHLEFLFPFPDYKLPQLIIREPALTFPQLNLGTIIGQFPGRDYTGRTRRYFDERLCWLTLARNDLIPHFSNSFLIAASLGNPKPLCEEEWLLKLYNLGRKPAYCTESSFLPQNNQTCQVQKKPIFPAQKETSATLHHVFTQEAYVPGKHLGEMIAKGLLNQHWHSLYLEQLRSWVAYLKQFQLTHEENLPSEDWQIPSPLEQSWLPGHLVDCIPRNLVYDGNQWQYIDQEWIVPTPIPTIWVVFRGILTDISVHLSLARQSPIFKNCSLQEWVIQTIEQVGYFLGHTTLEKNEMFSHILEWDIRFRLEISHEKEAALREALHLLLNEQMGIFSEVTTLENQASEHRFHLLFEMEAIKSSNSYQLSRRIQQIIPAALKPLLKTAWQYAHPFVSRTKQQEQRVSKIPHHICMIVPSFDRIGGYERQAYSMCLAYQKMGKHPYIVTQNIGNLPSYEIREGVEIYRFYPFFQKFTDTYTQELEKLFAFDLAGKIDIVHCHAFDFTSGWAIQIATRYQIPTLVKIATERDTVIFQQHIQTKTKGFQEAFNNLMQATRFISLNPNISRELVSSHVPENKILSFPNGVDVHRFHPLATEKRKSLKQKLGLSAKQHVITYTGRFEERKRVIDLIHAWHAIASEFPQAHLVLVGKGEEVANCQNEIQVLGLSQRVTFVGEVQNIEDYLKITDCYVFPSRLEGMPNVILEAMACGLPIIATAIPGIVEILQDNQTGKLVPPKDVNTLCRALTQMLKNPEAAWKLGNAAREEVLKNYSFEILGKKYFEIYQALLNQDK